MKKIPSLFQRNYDGDRLVRDEVVPGCEWVLAGEGVATVKLDGTSCLVQDGILYKRYDAKKGKAAPEGWIPCEEAADPNTGHWPGWLPVGDGPEDRWHREAWDFMTTLQGVKYNASLPDGTYELIGPRVQGNPHGATRHGLVRHGDMVPETDAPRTFNGLKEYFASNVIEGLVWHHPDGRMCKLKRRDFGYAWPVKKVTE